MPWEFGLVLEARQFRVISPRRCICNKSLTKRNFEAGSWISEQNFAQRRRISRLLLSVESRQKERGWNSYTERKTEECFQRKPIGSCSRGDNCSFSTHVCHGTPWDYVERSGRRKEISPRASILFRTESEKTDSREKLKQSKGQSWDWSFKSLVCGRQDEKDRRVIIDTIPCVVFTSVETDAFVAFVAFFRHADCEK